MVLVVRKNNWLLEYQGGLVLGNIVMLVAWFCEGNNKKNVVPDSKIQVDRCSDSHSRNDDNCTVY